MAGLSDDTANAAPSSVPISSSFYIINVGTGTPHHNTTIKTPNLLRELINNDQQEREEDNGLPIASKDGVRLTGEEGAMTLCPLMPSSVLFLMS